MSKKEKNIIGKRLVHSYLSSVVSISLVLLFAGLAGLIIVNVKSFVDYFKENITISTILIEDAGDKEATKLFNQLKREPFIKDAKYISKEQGTEEMKRMLGEDFLNVFEANPIPISFEMQLVASYIDNDSLKKIESMISSKSLVREVIYQRSLVDVINSNLERIGYIIIVFVGLLLFVSYALISNTVRLNVYSKRFSIHVMRLVGATKSFIRRPFLYKAFFQGMISGLLADLVLLSIIYYVKENYIELFSILEFQLLLYVLAVVLALGVCICVVSTYIIMSRLINITKDELYL